MVLSSPTFFSDPSITDSFSFQHFVKVTFPNRLSLVLFSIYIIHFEVSAPYSVVVKAACSGANCEE